MKSRPEQALAYHEQGRPGKIAVAPTTRVAMQRDLDLAYSPGVAKPCRRIAEDPESAFRYTARGNLVAIVANGGAAISRSPTNHSARHPASESVSRATALAWERAPGLMVDGEVQAGTAVEAGILATYRFHRVAAAGQRVDLPGPRLRQHLLPAPLAPGRCGDNRILLGMARPVHVLLRGSHAADIVNLAAIAVVDAQLRSRSRAAPGA